MKTCVTNNIPISCIPSPSFSLCFSLKNHGQFHFQKNLDGRNTTILFESWAVSCFYVRLLYTCVSGISLGPASCQALGESLDRVGSECPPPGHRHSWLYVEVLTNGIVLPKTCAVLWGSINSKGLLWGHKEFPWRTDIHRWEHEDKIS